MPDQFVETKLGGGVATLMLNRPPANLMNIEMMEQINSALLDFRQQSQLRVLVVRGVGATFCGGVEAQDHTREKVVRMLQVFYRIFETIRMMEVIAVSAVQGSAWGGGFELAIGCNMVLAAESATFALPQIKMGVFPPLAAVVLTRAGPRRKAMEWILTGDEIPARELERFGLVNRVVPDDRFEEELDTFVNKLASKSGPVLQLAKRAQIESYYSTYEEALYKVENKYLRDLMSLEDPQEGIESMIEGREPRWVNG